MTAANGAVRGVLYDAKRNDRRNLTRREMMSHKSVARTDSPAPVIPDQSCSASASGRINESDSRAGRKPGQSGRQPACLDCGLRAPRLNQQAISRRGVGPTITRHPRITMNTASRQGEPDRHKLAPSTRGAALMKLVVRMVKSAD